jgi:hypothetical protein
MSGVFPTSSAALREILGVLSKALQLRHARSMSPPPHPALRHAPPHPATPYPRKLGYLSVWECIPINWGIPVCGDASPYTWGITIYGDVFPYTWVPHYMRMHSHILGYTWGIPVYEDASPHFGVPHYICMHSHMLGTLAGGDASPCTGVSQYMRMHPHMLGCPIIWGCIPIHLGAPLYGDAFPNIGVP